MKPVSHIYLYQEDLRVFGKGPCMLLCAIEEKGSLRAAAASMGLSYSKAIQMVQRAESAFGFPLTEKTIGGKGGGGSQLTADARLLIEKFQTYEEACHEATTKLYETYFGKCQLREDKNG